jgi:hypothetical protein
MWRCNEKVSGGAGMTNAVSVKDRLKKQAGNKQYRRQFYGYL